MSTVFGETGFKVGGTGRVAGCWNGIDWGTDGWSGGNNDARKRRISLRSSLSSSLYRWQRSDISDRRDKTSSRRFSPSCIWGFLGLGWEGMVVGSVDDWRTAISFFYSKVRNFSFPICNFRARCWSSIALWSFGVEVERGDSASGPDINKVNFWAPMLH